MTARGGYTPPEGLVLTPAMREALGEYREKRAALAAIDRATVDAWYAEARERTFSRLDAWLEHGRTA